MQSYILSCSGLEKKKVIIIIIIMIIIIIIIIMIIIIIIIIIIMDNCYISVFFIRNELTAPGRVKRFEACCQWVLLSVQI